MLHLCPLYLNKTLNLYSIVRKCSQRGNFQRAFNLLESDELTDRLNAEDVTTFADLAYCEEQNEDCLLNKCNTCGKNVESKLQFFLNRLGGLSDETLALAYGWQSWEKDENGVWTTVEYLEPLLDALKIIVQWIIDEKIGLHERQIVLQSKFQRDMKSWDYESNEPHSSISRDGLYLRWDHAMKPTMSNSRELQAQHWSPSTIPLMGFIATYRLNDEASELDGKLMKRHIFVTAPTTAKDNWHFTILALKSVLDFLFPIIGKRKQLTFLADGSTKQVNFVNIFVVVVLTNS